MDMQQHGDVLLAKVAELPNGARLVKPRDGRHILADGEVTGHAHAVADAPGVEMYASPDGTLYLSVTDKPVELTHEEHATQVVKPGIYEVGGVVEVDPFQDAVRRVLD